MFKPKNMRPKKKNSSFHNIPIKKGLPKNFQFEDLIWDTQERNKIVRRILALRDDQIGALGHICVKFLLKDIDDVVAGIRKFKEDDINLDVMLTEADSKEQIEWWINYFERENRK